MSIKSIITGGAGFIGSHLADLLLSHGHEVTVIDNLSTGRIYNIDHIKNQINFIEADISECGDWRNSFENVDYVFHLAALADIVPSIQKPDEYFKSNVVGTFNILEACKKNKIKKLVYSASSSCYGIPEIFPTPETAAIKPEYPYALTKRIGEELILHWSKLYNIPSISLRFFNVYGPRSRTSGTYGAVFGVFLAQKLASKPLTVVGDGEQTRDFTYVSDIVDALFVASKSEFTKETYNVGSGKTISINRIVELLGSEKIFIPKRPGEPDSTFACIKKIKEQLGWMPKVSIEKGISELLKNINYWKDAPVWTPETIAKETVDWFKFLKD